MIALRDVRKSYPARTGRIAALDGISFTVADNEFVTIVGPSGCGKSTLLTLIAGLERPTSGQVLVEGRPVTGPGPDRGLVFQSYTLFPWLTVAENVAFGLRLAGHPPDAVRATVARYLELIGLAGFEARYPHELSGGMKQRVAIARALATRPRVLLIDEPFGALDAQTRLLMQELLCDVWQAERTTVLFVTHDVEEALFLGERVLVLTGRPGRLRAEFRVPLPVPRTPEMKEDAAFLRLKREVLALLLEGWGSAPASGLTRAVGLAEAKPNGMRREGKPAPVREG